METQMMSAHEKKANLVAQLDAFGLEHLRMVERPLVPLRHHDIRIRVRAASLNHRDLQIALGLHRSRVIDVRLPLIPLSDCAGEVAEVGRAVDRFRIGDRVSSAQMPDWTAGPFKPETLQSALGAAIDGVLGTYYTGNQRGFVRIPDALSFEEAATLPTAALTAWNALFEVGDLKPGETVLVQGSGGVSTFALQFALAAGARVLAITGSPAKAERLQELGAEHVIRHKREPEWSRAVLEFTGGAGVDHIVETCGAGTIDESIKAAATGGSISLIGLLTGAGGRFDMLPLLAKTLRVQGVVAGSVEMFERMVGMIEHLGIGPVIDRVFEMREIGGALEYLKSGRHIGKVVVKV
ncbi:MAG TPA: NAD(P)-dependent alcohol dehydrogenase [Steroidobacteraceae bacterium]|jgi:NADPH:quinone reductase-like Zn-dependent oxidoreductase|nr:NAD(P)-dependent alcohol dehydrogenase [Steroidobacteraceae bacterium]